MGLTRAVDGTIRMFGPTPNAASNTNDIATTSFVRSLISKVHKIDSLVLAENNTATTKNITGLLPNTSYSVIFTATYDSTTNCNATYSLNGVNQQAIKLNRYGFNIAKYNVRANASGAITVGASVSAGYSNCREIRVEAFMN